MKVYILDVLGSMPNIVRSILRCFSPLITFEFVTEPRTDGADLLVSDLKMMKPSNRVDMKKVLFLNHPLREKEVRSEFQQRLGLYRSAGRWMAPATSKPGDAPSKTERDANGNIRTAGRNPRPRTRQTK